MILQCWQPLTFGNRELFTIVSGTIGFYLSFFLSLSLSVWCQLRKSMSNESKLVALSRSFVRSFISLPVGQIVRTILCYVNVHYIEQQRKHSNTHTHTDTDTTDINTTQKILCLQLVPRHTCIAEDEEDGRRHSNWIIYRRNETGWPNNKHFMDTVKSGNLTLNSNDKSCRREEALSLFKHKDVTMQCKILSQLVPTLASIQWWIV